MTTNPKRRRSRTVARKRPGTAARKRPAKTVPKKPSRPRGRSAAIDYAAARRAMRVAFDKLVVPTRPLAESIVCGKLPVATSGKEDYATAHTATAPDEIVLICYGFGFGTGVPVTFTKTSTGFSFEGSRPFCRIEKCSNHTGSTETTSVKGTINKAVSPETIALTYEVRAYCGGELTCIETGTFEGKKIVKTSKNVTASYQGPTSWTLACCPERKWAHSINPPVPPPGGGAFRLEPRSGPRVRTKAKRKGR
jgi:hypothetical protein